LPGGGGIAGATTAATMQTGSVAGCKADAGSRTTQVRRHPPGGQQLSPSDRLRQQPGRLARRGERSPAETAVDQQVRERHRRRPSSWSSSSSLRGLKSPAVLNDDGVNVIATAPWRRGRDDQLDREWCQADRRDHRSGQLSSQANTILLRLPFVVYPWGSFAEGAEGQASRSSANQLTRPSSLRP
jgi:hypothetical protein